MLDLASIAIGVHIATYHFDRSQRLNDFNPGAYVRMDRWQVGAYWNSNRRPSAYVSYAFPLTQRLALGVGLVTGYEHVKPVAPAVVLSYSFDNGLRLVGIPATPKNSGGLHVAYEFQGERR